MCVAKVILGLGGGVLIGLYLTGHNVVGAVGLAFDKQPFLGLIAFLLSWMTHVMGGGSVLPFSAKEEAKEQVADASGRPS